MRKKMTPEGYVKQAVEEMLVIQKVPYWRMNSGDHFGSYTSKKTGKTNAWRIRGHEKGTADFLCTPIDAKHNFGRPVLLWVEVKGPDGIWEDDQKAFCERVLSYGHRYIVVDDVTQLLDYLRKERLCPPNPILKVVSA